MDSVRFAERRNLFSARVPSHFKRSLPIASLCAFRITVGAGIVPRLRDRWSGLRVRAVIGDPSPLLDVETATGTQSATYSMVSGCSFFESRAVGR